MWPRFPRRKMPLGRRSIVGKFLVAFGTVEPTRTDPTVVFFVIWYQIDVSDGFQRSSQLIPEKGTISVACRKRRQMATEWARLQHTACLRVGGARFVSFLRKTCSVFHLASHVFLPCIVYVSSSQRVEFHTFCVLLMVPLWKAYDVLRWASEVFCLLIIYGTYVQRIYYIDTGLVESYYFACWTYLASVFSVQARLSMYSAW